MSVGVRDFATMMVSEPIRVLLYEQSREALAHEVMEAVAETLVAEISVSNPSLDNLIVIDHFPDLSSWLHVLPNFVEVWSMEDVADGRTSLDRSQVIITFGSGILDSPLIHRVTHSTRFYAALPDSSWNRALVAKHVHPARKAIVL